MEQNTVAIVCGGGPAPGINSVISAVTIEADKNGWNVVGVYDGFSYLAQGEPKTVKLTYDNVSTIHLRGGCILHMARFNPTKNEADLENVVKTLRGMGVNNLVTIGGDDTAYSAAKVSEYARNLGQPINVVHVPKTIDIDLPLPERGPTFGFETARQFGAAVVNNLMEDARTTNNRWYLGIAMGRTAGHLALGIGQSAGAIITIIPEDFNSEKIRLQAVIDMLLGSIVKRYLTDRNYGVAIIAEGVIEKIEKDDLCSLEECCLDEHGHIRYAEIDFGGLIKKQLVKELKKIGLKITLVDKEIGYELRCVPPIAYDIEYTRSLGYAAFNYLADGQTDAIVTMQCGEIKPLKFAEICDAITGKTVVRRVDTTSMHYKIAQEYMVKFVEADFTEDDKCHKIAQALKMTAEEFKNKYSYLLEV